MSYVKTTWVDDVTPASALNMNNIESGIENASTVNQFPTATGTGTAIILTVPGFHYVNGQAVTFIAAANIGEGIRTINVNGMGARGAYSQLSIGAASPILSVFIAGRAYTVWYSSSDNVFYSL